MKKYFKIYVIGYLMGAADLIPGVSGGTIAFLSGIYEELIVGIKTLSGPVLRLFLTFKFKQAINLIQFKFLIPLAIGLLSATLSLARLLNFLLLNYPIYVWALFFGLVFASTFVVLKKITAWNYKLIILFLISSFITYIVVGAIPIETPNTLFYIFLSGVIAVCAMILPGISGSFILVLLGKYSQILGAITNKDLLTLFVFALGCAVGISIFSRILSFIFKNYHNVAIAILAGVMFGSIRKLWPFKITLLSATNRNGDIIPVIQNNVLPWNYNKETYFALLLMLLGFLVMFAFDKVKK